MTLEDLVKAAAERIHASCDATEGRWFVNVPVSAGTEDEDERTQLVTVESTADGHHALIATDVGTLAPAIDLVPILEQIASSLHARVFLRTVEGQRTLAVGAAAPLSRLEPDSLADLVREVAIVADRLEATFFS
jgi:hypothetical protein